MVIQPDQIYQHFKGGRYEILEVGRIKKTSEEVVVYRSLQAKNESPAGSVWVRPLTEFAGMAEYNGRQVARFQLVSTRSRLTIHNLLLVGAAPFFVFLLNCVFYAFWRQWYLEHGIDTPFHFFGGVSIAVSACYALRLLEEPGQIYIKSRLLAILIIIATVIMAAVLWEFYEFLSDQFLGTNYQPSNWDTMKDLIMGALGGTVTSFLLLFRNQKIG